LGNGRSDDWRSPCSIGTIAGPDQGIASRWYVRLPFHKPVSHQRFLSLAPSRAFFTYDPCDFSRQCSEVVHGEATKSSLQLQEERVPWAIIQEVGVFGESQKHGCPLSFYASSMGASTCPGCRRT
jgi:hypothetical protein